MHVFKQPVVAPHRPMLPPDLLSLVFARVGHFDLNRLLRTSRRFRTTVRQHVAQRCRLARSVFDTLAHEFGRRVGSTLKEREAFLQASFEGRRDGQLIVKMDIRMYVRLMQDKVSIKVSEERAIEDVAVESWFVPFRTDVFDVWPAENRMECNLNRRLETALPVPAELAEHLCANFMHPIAEYTEGLDIVCNTAAVYGR
jgi:hypothetical protein